MTQRLQVCWGWLKVGRRSGKLLAEAEQKDHRGVSGGLHDTYQIMGEQKRAVFPFQNPGQIVCDLG